MNIITRVAQRLGVVRASRYVAAVNERHKAEARAATLLAEVEKLRAASRGWKDKADALSQALKQAQSYGKRAQSEAERARADAVAAQRDARRGQHHAARAEHDAVQAQRDAARHIERLEKGVARADEENARLRGRLEPLAQRLAAAERDLAVARETLMAIDVKLDILEGAANVLDRRTRVDGAPQSRPGTPA